MSTKESLKQKELERKQKLKESMESKKIRKYRKNPKQSPARLGITDEMGWNDEMRRIYYNMAQNFDKFILKFDFTNRENRPHPEMGKKEYQKWRWKQLSEEEKLQWKAKGNNYVEGFWSDAKLEKALDLAKNFSRFVIWNEYERRKNGEKPRNLRSIANLCPRDWYEYLEAKKEGRFGRHYLDGKPCTNSTLTKKYISEMQKIMDCTFKCGVRSHQNFLTEKARKKADSYSGIQHKNERIRSRGKNDGIYGYTLDQAVKIIEASENDPYMQTLYVLETYIGLRFDNFRKMQWKDVIDPETGRVGKFLNFSFEERHKLKNGRVLSVINHEEVRKRLQDMWGLTNGNLDAKIWGDNLSESAFYKHLQKTCNKAGVDYKAYHAFRTATVAYYDDKVKGMSKRELIDGILRAVNTIKYFDEKTGKWEYPLNPLVEKKKVILRKNGKPIKIGTDKEGKPVYKKEVEKDPKTGEIIKVRKFNRDYLWTKSEKQLREDYITQIISHNRADANNAYREDSYKS